MGRGSKQSTVALLLLMVTMSSTASCSAADDVVRVLGHEVGSVDDVARQVPKARLPGSVLPERQVVQAEIETIMSVLRGDDGPSAKQVLDAACLASDLGKVNSWDSAVDFALQQTDTPHARRESVKELAQNLSEAEGSGDQARIIAAATICQWAGS